MDDLQWRKREGGGRIRGPMGEQTKTEKRRGGKLAILCEFEEGDRLTRKVRDEKGGGISRMNTLMRKGDHFRVQWKARFLSAFS